MIFFEFEVGWHVDSHISHVLPRGDGIVLIGQKLWGILSLPMCRCCNSSTLHLTPQVGRVCWWALRDQPCQRPLLDQGRSRPRYGSEQWAVNSELVAPYKGRTRPSIAFADRFIIGAFGFSLWTSSFETLGRSSWSWSNLISVSGTLVSSKRIIDRDCPTHQHG